MDNLQNALKTLNELINNLGLDIVQVETETVWQDPNNVTRTLEQTELNRRKLLLNLRLVSDRIKSMI